MFIKFIQEIKGALQNTCHNRDVSVSSHRSENHRFLETNSAQLWLPDIAPETKESGHQEEAFHWV